MEKHWKDLEMPSRCGRMPHQKKMVRCGLLCCLVIDILRSALKFPASP